MFKITHSTLFFVASIAQLGERQTEDLKVPRSIRGRGILFKKNFQSHFLFPAQDSYHVFRDTHNILEIGL